MQVQFHNITETTGLHHPFWSVLKETHLVPLHIPCNKRIGLETWNYQKGKGTKKKKKQTWPEESNITSTAGFALTQLGHIWPYTCVQPAPHQAHIRVCDVLIKHQAVYLGTLTRAAQHKCAWSGDTFTEYTKASRGGLLHSNKFIASPSLPNIVYPYALCSNNYLPEYLHVNYRYRIQLHKSVRLRNKTNANILPSVHLGQQIHATLNMQKQTNK